MAEEHRILGGSIKFDSEYIYISESIWRTLYEVVLTDIKVKILIIFAVCLSIFGLILGVDPSTIGMVVVSILVFSIFLSYIFNKAISYFGYMNKADKIKIADIKEIKGLDSFQGRIILIVYQKDGESVTRPIRLGNQKFREQIDIDGLKSEFESHNIIKEE
ncbi:MULTISPECIES: hypothetical protein [Halomicrobium]|uniref:Uncharacterized protein n=1 Tax=Halomicrobium mukohataei TaxID=57705 RepID=A0A4D6KBV1_9EURY|nr:MULTISPECIES: hypothetical protein [Halomicrobium]QCD65457.1 hypothetical protein E5139_07320 [Halomicrobium mukohataei]QFR20263.1 hypothetical protein GBQ70_07315 [Halomicrobium sp. ZPS1]